MCGVPVGSAAIRQLCNVIYGVNAANKRQSQESVAAPELIATLGTRRPDALAGTWEEGEAGLVKSWP